MADWLTEHHLPEHYGRHRGGLGSRSVDEYDASAQQTIELGKRFTYRDIRTGANRISYYHRDSARFVGLTVNEKIVTHHRLDEDDVYGLPLSTYWDE